MRRRFLRQTSINIDDEFAGNLLVYLPLNEEYAIRDLISNNVVEINPNASSYGASFTWDSTYGMYKIVTGSTPTKSWVARLKVNFTLESFPTDEFTTRGNIYCPTRTDGKYVLPVCTKGSTSYGTNLGLYAFTADKTSWTSNVTVYPNQPEEFAVSFSSDERMAVNGTDKVIQAGASSTLPSQWVNTAYFDGYIYFGYIYEHRQQQVTYYLNEYKLYNTYLTYTDITGIEPIDVNEYATMIANEDNFKVSFYNPSSSRTLYYCIDGDGNWRTLSSNTSTSISTTSGQYTEAIQSGQTLSFKSVYNSINTGYGLGRFVTSGSFDLIGNAMSLVRGNGVSINDSSNNQFKTTENYAFTTMFYSSKVVSVSENFLPATTLSTGCYKQMFYGCSLLTSPPKLPATTLSQHCYNSMFQSCTSLVESPVLPAQTLVSYCYTNMFRYCSKLSKITMLATGGSGTSILAYWVQGVASSGVFLQSQISYNNGTFPVGVSGIPSGWTSYPYVFNIDSYSGDWRESTTVPNPDPDKYWGVYESVGNYNVNNKSVCMYITFSGLNTFKLYIRSNAESNYDYVMVTQPDQWVNHATSQNSNTYSNTTLIKAHTRGAQNSGTALSNYKLVEFTGLDYGTHTIQVIYRKDSSAHSGTDRGYVLIPKYGPTTFSQTSGGYT